MADTGRNAPEQPSYDELRSRIAIARSILGHAPLYRAVSQALAALDGATLEQLAAGHQEPAEPPAGEPRLYLRGWHDGWDAGYANGSERRGEVAGTAA